MRALTSLLIAGIMAIFMLQCNPPAGETVSEPNEGDSTVLEDDPKTVDSAATYGSNVRLPAPRETEGVKNEGKVLGWEDGQKPVPPEGFTINRFAGDLNHPRWLYFAPNRDVFVAEANDDGSSANRILLLRDNDYDGVYDLKTVFLDNLDRPFGMLILNGSFYVANQSGIWRYPYEKNEQKITASGTKILDLPTGGYNHHWTRNIIANRDGSKIYVSVGSASNVGEYGMQEEVRRANILEINPDGSNERIYASGLRNPVGMDWNPITGQLWTAVNERDNIGDNLVPDYITSVERGAFYGWPYAYWGKNTDPRRKGEAPEMVEKSIKPDYALGAHTSSLGLAFYDQKQFPAKYHNGAFIAQHGSWNRSTMIGYTVLFVPFSGGQPSGKPEKFLTGFIKDLDGAEVYGRPVGAFVSPDGSLYVTDDDGNSIWKVTYDQKK